LETYDHARASTPVPCDIIATVAKSVNATLTHAAKQGWDVKVAKIQHVLSLHCKRQGTANYAAHSEQLAYE